MEHQQKKILRRAVSMVLGLTITAMLAGCGGGGGSSGGTSAGSNAAPTATVVIIPAKIAVVTPK